MSYDPSQSPFTPPIMTLGPQMPVAQAAPIQQTNSITDNVSPLLDFIKNWNKPRDDKDDVIWNLVKKVEDLRSKPISIKDVWGPQSGSDTGTTVSPSMGNYLNRVSRWESGDKLDARNPSGATGLFQFMPATWRGIMQEAPELGLTEEGITTREQQEKAMHYYTKQSASILKPLLGREPTGGELYLLHLLGHGGGPAVLKNLDAPITETISGPAIRGNPFLNRYKTGRDLIAGLNRQFG